MNGLTAKKILPTMLNTYIGVDAQRPGSPLLGKHLGTQRHSFIKFLAASVGLDLGQ